MKHTKEMLAAVLSELEGVDPGDEDAEKAAIADGLDVALADFELPPFVLSELEEARVRAYEHQSASVGQKEMAALVRRAQHTLAAPAQDAGLSGGVRVSQYQRLSDRIAELDADRSAAYDRIAQLEAQLADVRRDRDGLLRQRSELITARLAAPAQAVVEWSEADYQAAVAAFWKSRPGNPAVHAALDAVKHRLAAPAIESLSEELRAAAATCVSSYSLPTAALCKSVAAELLRRCPKPAPKQKTPRELLAVIRNSVSDDYEDALDELVRLAEIGASK